MKRVLLLIAVWMVIFACNKRTDAPPATSGLVNPAGELFNFTTYENNPVFSGTGKETWDEKIRERGFILFEDGQFHMWYTGFRDKEGASLHLGYATSLDGINWTRYAKNPVVATGWVEDMCVVKHDGTYYMFAEGKDDVAHLLTSNDRVTWKEEGDLDIRLMSGQPIAAGPRGTPAAWFEDGTWRLLYERGDLGIWYATSKDLKTWTNVQDEPVFVSGPELYDKYGIAVNQVIKQDGKYYAYYHATAFEDWAEWSSCVAISEDLIHWTKYENNPIQVENKSSPIIVFDGKQNRLYTMHPAVALHFPASSQSTLK